MTRRTLHLRGMRAGSAEEHQPPALGDRPAWFTDDRRRCSQANPDWQQWTSDEKPELNIAARKCREHCPFLQQCRAWAIETGQRHYVWGGMNLSKDAERQQAAAVRAGLPPPDTHDALERALERGGLAFHRLTPEQQAKVVAHGLEQGMSYPELAQRLRRRITVLQQLAGHEGPTFDEQVRELYDEGHNDAEAAEKLGVPIRMVEASRKVQNLPGRNRSCSRQRSALLDQISRLHTAGLAAGVISLEVGIHPSTISKIIKEELCLPPRRAGRPRKAVPA